MKKLTLIPIVFLLSMLLVNAIVGSQITISTNGGTSSSTINLNTKLIVDFTPTGGAAEGDIDGIAVTVVSAGITQNTTERVLVNVTNSSASGTVFFTSGTSYQTHLNETIGANYTSALQEGNDYTLTAYIYFNNTQVSNTLTNVIIDTKNTAAPTAITFSNPVENGETITATIDRLNANRCFIRFGGATVPRQAMTLSGSTCTYTASRTGGVADYNYQAFVEADDRTNSTLSVVQYINLDIIKSDGGGLFGGALVTSGATGGQSALGGAAKNPFAPKNNNMVLGFVLLIAAFLYYRNKKG